MQYRFDKRIENDAFALCYRYLTFPILKYSEIAITILYIISDHEENKIIGAVPSDYNATHIDH